MTWQLKITNLFLTRQKKGVFCEKYKDYLYKSLKGGLPIMKKIFAIFVAMVFVASLSLSVVGCKKAEEPAPVPAVEQPAPAPAPEAAPAPAPAPEAAPAPAPAK
ncbi:MAG: hypothetical protein WBN66_00545 [Smithella sp.]